VAVEVGVRVHHQQLVVRVLDTKLRLDAGARLIRRRRFCCLKLFSKCNGQDYGIGLGGRGGLVGCAWSHLQGRFHVSKEGLRSKTKVSRAYSIGRSAHQGSPLLHVGIRERPFRRGRLSRRPVSGKCKGCRAPNRISAGGP
jgi:hypothetical protein